ncbi:NHS-like protein 3 isoform X3 [Anolis carolinensis]|uniref:NHS-like protein 3 isoform X3 n=1 Tax=Anolis carolinensis TaxID=28377 RepID=UPI002F2B8260
MGNSYRKRNPPSAKSTWSFWNFGRPERAKTGAAAKAENERRLSVQYKAGEEQPDNVFFPSSRTAHLEQLHFQAQAGLRSLQDQEKHKQTKRAWDHSDASSIQSSPSSIEGDDVSIRSQTPSCTTETTSEDALSVRSEMIQRKGSTFRPHDSFPKSGKGEKRRRERRTTVLGLPHHVQKELGLSNGYDPKKRPGSIAVRSTPSPQPLANGGQVAGNTIIIPTIDGKLQPAAVPKGGARVSLQALEVKTAAMAPTAALSAAESALQRHIDRVYYDDSLLGRKTEAKLSPLVMRPKSLAVPWMTTQPGSPELLGPVMSISPQGTYLSKIIPNAVMPPMVDVIALSRNRVRTLSRCSLSTASPAPSVRSVGLFPPVPRSREHSSSSDNWSHSQSTETIVSNTSTISSHGGRKDNSDSGPNRQHEPDQLSTYSSVSGTGSRVGAVPASPSLLGVTRLPGGSGGGSSGRASPAYSTGSVADSSDSVSLRSDRSSTRSVSLRKMKRAPAPPRRTYSLHQKAQQLEAEGAPRAMGLPPKPDRRPAHNNSSEVWVVGQQVSLSLTGEDEVFSPSCPSESSSLACSPDISHRSPITVDKLREAEELRAAENQGLPSKNSSPDRFGRTMSPSSGYSSQSGTPTLHTKSPLGQASSPGKKRPQPKKPERVCSLQSPTAGLSVSSSLTSLSSSTSDPATVPLSAVVTDGTMLNKAERFVIPPHPKVPAPTCLPPIKAQLAEPKTDNVAITNKQKSPPPSPPPAYHPPPPPAKKADASLEAPAALAIAVPSSLEVVAEAPPDSLWPPPPPPVPEEQDLSMADFPPPDEEYFSLLSPESQPESTAKEMPFIDATDGPPLGVPPTNQRAVSAGEAKEPTSLPSSSTMASSKSQQQGVPGDSALPAPTPEPPPPPKLPAAMAELPTAQKNHKPPATVSSSSVPSPTTFQAPSNLKKLVNGLHPDLKKEPAARSKSSSVPKEDANLPIVTPSLLQMVRLRSVNMDAHGSAAVPTTGKPLAEQNGPSVRLNGKTGLQQPTAPQKPIRKSLSLRGHPSASKEATSSNPLHNAVRLKASTLSSRDVPGLGAAADRKAGNRMTLPAFPTSSLSTTGEAKDSPASPLHKSPASTASFIFARSPKKLVIESPSSPEAQANLQKNLVAELMTVSGQRAVAAPGLHHQASGKAPGEKAQKVPPPIAKKPLLGPGHLQPPRSPRSTGAEELSSPVVAFGERTKDSGSGSQAVVAGTKGDGPSAVPGAPLQSPPAQDPGQEMA